eukprot:scaffold436063_cov18-Prasinocladus_malaysianus.AAC.1
MTTFVELKQGFISCCPAVHESRTRPTTADSSRGGDRASPEQLYVDSSLLAWPAERCLLGRLQHGCHGCPDIAVTSIRNSKSLSHVKSFTSAVSCYLWTCPFLLRPVSLLVPADVPYRSVDLSDW